MRADRAITQCQLDFGSYYEKVNADYINKLRYERLMRASKYWHLYASHWEWDISYIEGNSVVEIEAKEWRRCRALRARRIAESYKARARKIKEGM